MITITQQDNGVLFTFENSDKYLYGNGSILVPFNSLTIIEDKSEMITFRKAASNDIFLSARYDTDLGYSTKDEAVEALKSMLFAEAGGGGITPEEVEAMIDEATSGIPSSQVVEQLRTDVNTVSGQVQTKAETTAVTQAISDATAAITAIDGVLTAHTADTTIHVTAQDKTNWNNKLDASAYTPTDLSNYYTKDEVDDAELATAHALNLLNDEINTKEEVVASALTELNESKANVYYIDFWGIYNETVQMTDELYDEIVEAFNNNAIFYSVLKEEGSIISDLLFPFVEDNTIIARLYYGNGTYGEIIIDRTDGRDGYEYTITSGEDGIVIDDQLDSGSTNPVQNAVITQAIEALSAATSGGGSSITVDATLNSGSTNPVANSAITAGIDAVKAYYLDFATLTTQGINDNDWDGLLAAIAAHRPIYAGLGNLYYTAECLNVNGNTIKLTASDDAVHYFYTFTKNGSQNYSFSYETRPYVTAADKVNWNSKVSGTGISTIVKIEQSDYDDLVDMGLVDENTLYVVIPDSNNQGGWDE